MKVTKRATSAEKIMEGIDSILCNDIKEEVREITLDESESRVMFPYFQRAIGNQDNEMYSITYSAGKTINFMVKYKYVTIIGEFNDEL